MKYTRILTSSVSSVTLLLLASCGGNAGSGGEPAVTTAAARPTDAVAQPPSEQTTFRLGYSNPGGMWMPSQMTLPQHVDTFQKMGVAMDPKSLSNPLSDTLSSVVWLGGCTASFVSDEGFLVTNHHCVQGALQHNATPSDNLVENGFLAKTKADEKTAGPSQRVMVAQAFRDVTKEVRDGLDKITDFAARREESEKRQKGLVTACEKDRPGVRCQVSSFFRGDQYQLIEMMELRDVRLVYAPARSVGNFGGEIDNWEWPRHTGDWSYYRAYVGKDGKPADFSPDNVPFKPKHHLQVTTAGLKPGDFVMITGYPGMTQRTTTASEIHFNMEWGYQYRIQYYKDRYDIAEAHLKDGGETAIKATVAKQGIQNGLEKYEGIFQGLSKGDLVAQKDELDKKAKAWAAMPGHEAQKTAIDKLETVLADQRKTARADFDRNVAFSGSSLLGEALSFARWSEERVKKDADRKQGFQDRDMPRAVSAQKGFTKRYDRTLDRANFRLALVRATKLPEADRPWLPTLLGAPKGAKIDEAMIDKTLDAWYKAPTLEADQARLDLLQKGTMKDLQASKDPFVQAALRIYPTYKAEEKKSDAKAGEMMTLAPMYAVAMKEALGGVLAPDANSTLRVTYGTVRGLHPEQKDEANWPFTVSAQLLKKNTGKEPFNAPDKLTNALKAKKFGGYADATLGGDLPIDFMSDLDITGGNSGSPTLNDKGELVGLAFDGNKEGLASDVVFDPKNTRTIQVDARYMVWVMDAVDGAGHLLKEMGVKSKL